MRKKVVLAYTHSAGFPHLLHRLAKLGRDVLVFNNECPELKKTVDQVVLQAQILLTDVEIKCTDDWNEVLRFEPDALVFLNINIQPKSTDLEFLALCKNELKYRPPPAMSSVFFSGDYRGLIAASVYVENFKNNYVNVISSIYHSSVHIFGEDLSHSRAISKSRGEIFVKEGTEEASDAARQEMDLQKIDQLRGVWEFGDFELLESQALFSAIDVYLETDTIASLEMTGRVPEKKETEDYDLPEDVCVWLPTSDDVNMDDQAFKNNLKGIATEIEDLLNSFKIDLSTDSEGD